MFTINNTSLFEDEYTIEEEFTAEDRVAISSEEGYSFNGWYGTNTETGDEYSFGGSTITIPEGTYGDIVLYVQWKTNEFTLSFVTNGGKEIPSQSVKFNQSVDLPDTTRDGYTFAGWFSDKNLENVVDDPFTMPASKTTLYADWTANPYDIVFNTNGGTWTNQNITDPYHMTFDFGKSISGLPSASDITKKGYKFGGWYKDVNCTIVIPDEMNVVGGFTAYAKWEIISYNIVLSGLEEATYNSSTSFTYTIENPTFTLNTPSKEGYTFNNWSSADIEYNLQTNVYNVLASSIGKDITITANWNINKYTISLDGKGGIFAKNSLEKYDIEGNYGSPITEPEITKTGFKLVGWYYLDSNNNEIEFSFDEYTSMPANNYNLYAKWSEDTFEVKYEFDEGIVSDSEFKNPNELMFGELIPLPNSENFKKAGYKFIGWYYDDTFTDENRVKETDTMPAKNITLYACWEAIEYSITYYNNAIHPDNVNETVGPLSYYITSEPIVVTNPTRPGYSFNYFGNDFTVTDGSKEHISVSADGKTFTVETGAYGHISIIVWWNATLQSIEYDLDGGNYYDAEGNIISNPNTTEYYVTTRELDLQDPTKYGYTFSHWTLNDEKLKENEDGKVLLPQTTVGRITLKAVYEIITYTITYNVGEGTISDDKPTTYKVTDAEFTIPNPTNGNSTFTSWTIVGYNNIKKTEVYKNDDGLTVIPTGSYGHLTLTANYNNQVVITLSDSLSGNTYNAENYKLVPIIKINNEPVDITTHKAFTSGDLSLSYVYKNKSTNEESTEGALNAGTYTVTAKLTIKENSGYTLGQSDLEAQLKIDPLKIKVSSEEFGVSFDSGSRTWSEILNNQISSTSSSIKFAKEDGTVLTDNLIPVLGRDYFVHSIDDGNSTYNNSSLSTDMVGSTYQMSLSIKDNDTSDEAKYSSSTLELENADKNYNFISNGNAILFKYKTANINGSWFTIEDAIENGSGTIILAGEYSNNYVRTTFTSLNDSITKYNDSHYNLKSKLRVPFDKEDMDYHGSGGQTGSADNGYESISITAQDIVYSVLEIPSDVVLQISSGGNLVVGSLMGMATQVFNRGVVMNYGKIEVEDGGNIQAYGYIKGTGTITLSSGAHAREALRIYDWPGGAHGGGLNNAGIFPVSQFTMHNISCITKFYSGSTYDLFWTIEFGNRLYTGFQRADTNGYFNVIGSSGNNMFNLSSGYMQKEAESVSNSSVFEHNQYSYQKDIFKIYGTCTDGSVSISISASGQSFSMKSSTELALPIGLMDIIIGNDGENIGNITISSSSFKFYPGTRVVVDEGASLNVESGASIIFYDVDTCVADESKRTYAFNTSGKNDSYLLVNGTVTIDSQSFISGYIDTTRSTGKLIINGNAYAETKRITNVSEGWFGLSQNYSTQDIVNYAKINQWTTNSNYELLNAESKTTYYANSGYWYKYGNATLTYDATLGSVTSKTKAIYIAENTGYSISNTINNDVIPTAPNKLYEFAGWYLDSSYNTSAAGVTIWKDMTLYAKWNIPKYTIIYDIDNYMAGTPIDGTASYIKESEDFNAETTSIILSYPTHSLNYNFAGWYYDSNYSTKINNLTLSNLAALAEYADSNRVVTLYALWYSDPIEVTYVNSNADYSSYLLNLDSKYKEIPADIGKVREFLLPDGMDDRNDDTGYNMYFDGWYLDDTYTKKIISFTDSGVLTDEMINSYINSKKLTLYAKWITKILVTYETNNSDYSFGEVYLLEQEIDSYTNTNCDMSNKNNDASYAKYFNGWEYGTISNYSCTISGKWVNKLSIYGKSISSGTTVTVTEVTSNTASNLKNGGTLYYLENTKIKITVSANLGSGNETITIDEIENYSSGTSFNISTNLNVSSTAECLVEGTLITMADGTKKKVEDIVPGDMLLIFNHETGKYDVAPVLFNDSEERRNYNVINLVFSDGTIIKVVSEHGFFDLDLMKYVYINESTYLDYVGHRFFYSDIINGSISSDEVTLVNSSITNEYTKVYSPVTKYHLNYFTNNLLSMPGGIEGLFNIFEYDETLKYDEEKKQNDIETYGLYTYEDFKDLVSYEIYESFPANYFKVAIGKGLLTWDDIYYYIERYTPLM